MKIVLPPKRFNDPSSPIYDPIRHRPWFRHLIDRRAKIPLLELAYRHLGGGSTQQSVAVEFGVDSRELRDYVIFKNKQSRIPFGLDSKYQKILDYSYEVYCDGGGALSIRECIDGQCAYWGVNGRYVVECWETDATFYPTGYDLHNSNA